ncbi:hypothetical protein QQG55_0030 [Brugia pahangi]
MPNSRHLPHLLLYASTIIKPNHAKVTRPPTLPKPVDNPCHNPPQTLPFPDSIDNAPPKNDCTIDCKRSRWETWHLLQHKIPC